MTELLYRDYKEVIKAEWQGTDWIIPKLPEVISWKDAPWALRAADRVIRWITFGKVRMSEDYAVMFNRSIITSDPDTVTLATYFHECWHRLQILENGGWLPYLFKYLFLPFPVFRTFRSKMEWEAYAISAWVEAVSSLSRERRNSGKSYVLAVTSGVFNKLTVNPGSRKRLKGIFFAFPYFFMDIKWKDRAKGFTVTKPSYFYRNDDPQCIISVPWRTDDEYTSGMKGFYQLMHRVLTRY